MALSFCRYRYVCRVLKQLRHQLGAGEPCRVSFSTTSLCQLHNSSIRMADNDAASDMDNLDDELERLQTVIAETEARAGRRVVKRRSGHHDNSQPHVPVMADRVLHYLQHLADLENQTILDMTFGSGGHSRALLDSVACCHIIALDRDPTAHQMACKLAQQRPGRVTPVLGRFSELPGLLSGQGVREGTLAGVLMDLGASSMQFDQSERGFSISTDGPLDMRMDKDRCVDQPTAADVVNTLDEVDLARIIKKYGEDGQARKIAHGIVEARARCGRIRSTQQLADIILEIFDGGFGTDKLGRYRHPATKTFQALRIFVNNEMNELNFGLEVAHSYLSVGGICVAISFHSLEDRIVKRHFKQINLDLEKGASLAEQRRQHMTAKLYTPDQLTNMTAKRWKLLNKKAEEPSDVEIETNPRSRSAKLRVARKVLH